jgi:hypothetical protein
MNDDDNTSVASVIVCLVAVFLSSCVMVVLGW